MLDANLYTHCHSHTHTDIIVLAPNGCHYFFPSALKVAIGKIRDACEWRLNIDPCHVWASVDGIFGVHITE